MTDNLGGTPSNKTNSTSKTTKQFTRRMLLQGNVGIPGLTGAITAGNAQANMQKPVIPKTRKTELRLMQQVVISLNELCRNQIAKIS